MQILEDILLWAMAIPLALFIGYYGALSRWSSTLHGITLMTQKIAMLILVGYFLLPDFPGRKIVLVSLLAVLAVLFWAMFFGLRAAQKSQAPVMSRSVSGFTIKRKRKH